MKRYLPPLAIFVWVTMLSVSMSAQTTVDVYTERLSKTTTASEIRKVLKAAEKDGLKTGDLLDLRYAAYLHTGKGMRDRTLDLGQRNLLLALSFEFGKQLPDQFERHLKEVERATPNNQEISRIAVRLSKLLLGIPIIADSTEKRAALAKRRDERVMRLYERAYQVESRLDPASTESVALKVLIAEEYLVAAEIEKALPLYEETLAAIERKEGKNSESRIRVLFHLAQIAELVGDTERFEILKGELSRFSVPYERTIPINARTLAAADGTRRDDIPIKLKLGPRSVQHSVAGRPIRPGDASKALASDVTRPRDEIRKLSPSDVMVRLEPKVDIVSGFRSAAYPAIVIVDVSGNVTDVEVIDQSAPRDEIIASVKQWKFRPLIYKGIPTPMKGLVYCWIVHDIMK